MSPTEQSAVSLGVSIMSAEPSGAPRLLRAIRPRPGLVGATPEVAARDHLTALAPLWVAQARPMALTNTGTQVLRNGATMVKLAQQVNGVFVDQGEVHVLMNRDGSLAAVSGTLLAAGTQPRFVASPSDALDHALDQQYGAVRARPAIADRGDDAGWQKLEVAPDPQVRVSDARVRPVLTRAAGTTSEGWEVELFGEAPPDPLRDPTIPNPIAWRYVISDATGQVIEKTDLMQHDAFVYRVWAETTGNRRPIDSPLTDFSPHPTGFPDGSTPTFSVPSNLVAMDAFNTPVDPWLPSNATTTSGNNANAFSDLDDTGTFTPGDIRPEVRAGRVLNYAYDTSLDALANPTQIKAGVVNTFYLVNWMHDWWYESGFTEATGTGQVDNYGRGGVAGDPLIISAQAGANVGQRDNATMSTPADGRSPQMRVFVFTTRTVSSLSTPIGAIRSEGVSAPPSTFDLSGTVALAADAVAPTSDACQPVTTDLTGKIALITFSGVCGSAVTVNNAKAAGAIAVILADGASDDPRGFAGSAAANIPTLGIGKTDGESLAAAVAAGPVVVDMHSAQFGVERDGDLDDGVAGHEWGHYLHHRLSVCTNGQQCGGMSEGWGDFNWLLTQIRENDARLGTYAQGSYADFDGTPNSGYFSIRRYPYSSDRSKNPLSLRFIGNDTVLPTDIPGGANGSANNEVHNAGEIWAIQLFEAFQLLRDEHGIQVARRRMTDYAAAGLMLTPPNPTFVEARDAILAAASALDSDDLLLLAAGFAGRGAGSCAVVPSNAVRTNVGVVESGTLAAKLTAGSLSLADDVVSIDHDGRLDPGESGLLHVTVVNGGPLAAENLSVTVTSTNAGVKIGTPVRLPLLAPFSSVSLTVPVQLLASAPANTPLTLTVRVLAEQTCDRNGITVVFTAPAGLADGTTARTLAAAPAPSAEQISDALLGIGRVVETYAPVPVSLAATDAAVCIANDTP